MLDFALTSEGVASASANPPKRGVAMQCSSAGYRVAGSRLARAAAVAACTGCLIAVPPVGGVSFQPQVELVAGTEPLGVAIADLDSDGMKDLVASIHEEDILAVFRQVEGPALVQFAARIELPAGLHPQEVAVADFDGDGRIDVAAADSGRGGGGTLSVFKNTSSPGTISIAPRIHFAVDTARRLAVGDLDLDGKIDIVVSSNSPRQFVVFRNESTAGSLAFSQSAVLSAPNHPNDLELVDLDGDRLRDLVAPTDKEGILSVYPNTSTVGNISFGPRADFPAGNDPDGPVVAQFDGTGPLDVVVTNIFSDTVSLLINRSTPGNLAFDPPLVFPAGAEPREPGLGDMDGDGLPDVVVQNVDDTVSVLRTVQGPGGVSLEVAAELETGSRPFFPVIGDINGDGRLDIALANHGANSIGVFLNSTELEPVEVDLTVTKDDGWPDAVAGETVTYVIEVGNGGPDDVAGAVVADRFDAEKFDVGAIAWTCARGPGAGPGTACPASGSGSELESGVGVDIEVGDEVVFSVEAAVLASATEALLNTATATVPEGVVERDERSNSSSDRNDLPAVGACGKPDQRLLTAETVRTTVVAEACISIAAQCGFRVESTGDLTFRAGERIVLGDGFSVGPGGRFVAEIDQALKP